MKARGPRGVCALVAVMMLVCGCQWVEKIKPAKPEETVEPETSAKPESSVPWLTNEWLADADVLIVAPLVIVFYEGTADGQRNAEGFWIGSVEGRVAMPMVVGVVACDRVEFSESDGTDVRLKIDKPVMFFGQPFELPELDECLADDLPPGWLEQLPDSSVSVSIEMNDMELETAPPEAEDKEPEVDR